MKCNRQSLNKVVFLGVMLICFYANGQENHKLSGRITDCKWKTVVPKTTVKLVSSSGINVETLSDSLGFYYFNDSLLKPNVSYVITTRSPITEDSKLLPFGKCPYSPCYSTKEYLNSSDKVKFKTDDSLQFKKYTHDFCLVELLRCGWSIPDLYFEKNTTQFGTEHVNYENFETSPDTTMDCLIGLMICNPDFAIEISGYADKREWHKQSLSEKRALKVYDLFIEKGVKKERLRVKSCGSKNPFMSNDEWGWRIKTPHYMNRRVTITLLAKDYKLLYEKKLPQKNEEGED